MLVGTPAVAGPEERAYAKRLFERLTGVPILETDARLANLEQLIAADRHLDAARIITDDPFFYNLTLRGFAAVMSNKDESPFVELDDFQALVIGSVRDDLDARTLLTGDFLYIGGSGSGIPAYNRASNDHYAFLDARQLNLKASLVRVTPQAAASVGVPASGLLTTRAWGKAHLEAGTNRRAVEHTFKQFLCAPITQWKDIGLPEYRIRRDVDRAPAGNPATFQNLCRSCHAGMDALGGAYARYDFVNGQIVHAGPSRVAAKYNQNGDTYPDGFVTFDDSWVNFSTRNHNQALGFRGSLEGNGLREFGAMVASAEGFSKCMVKRVFQEVCKRPLTDADDGMVADFAANFETGGYKLRRLFEEVAVSDSCLQ
jgi:hypothetical protein